MYSLMVKLPGLHPDSALYRTIIGTFSACAAPKVVLQMALIMAQQVCASLRQLDSGLHRFDSADMQA
jgi:hypothetical protein